MSDSTAPNYQKEIPDVVQALQAVHHTMSKHNFDRKLTHLVLLRASQINQCAFCVKMHLKEAREDGESNDRLDRVVVWRHVSDFSEREKAALAWTEVLTVLDAKAELAPLRVRLREHFSDQEISLLTATIGMINLWNRMQVSTH